LLENITYPNAQDRLIRERALADTDKNDEVWDGVYVSLPLTDDEHKRLVLHFGTVFMTVLGWTNLAQVRLGINVSDMERDWRGHKDQCKTVSAVDARHDGYSESSE